MSPLSERQVNRFSLFCRVYVRGQQTNRQTDTETYTDTQTDHTICVAIGNDKCADTIGTVLDGSLGWLFPMLK